LAFVTTIWLVSCGWLGVGLVVGLTGLGVGLTVGLIGFCVAGLGVDVGVGVLFIVGVGSVSPSKVDAWLPLDKRAKNPTETKSIRDTAITAFFVKCPV